ncbi:GNAT family N-acetyltransferase [Parabacteroides sp. Marseille-P3160]|uniref:GNAT family N-acetyltransferase n=1 Tax=Parabacteroides sp. Marseille-P3160 TaxID=1917887 RepID=UPI0009B9F60D|nr:GNAT family N-acetyltransferase [Parabacteroides sp. Marseille-P3160]
MRIIETGRLILRPITENDAEAIFEYSQSENVGPNAGWKPHANIEETHEIMKLIFLDKENVWGMVLKETGKLFGSIGLIPDPKRENDGTRMLGYAIGEYYWGRGYTTEAVRALINYGFYELELDLISAYCYPFNEKSKRVLKKCGFEYEGKLHLAEKRYDEEILDNECYAIKKPMSAENGGM